MADTYISWPSEQLPRYTNAAALPSGLSDGSQAITIDTHSLYIYNGSAWLLVANPGVATAIDALTGDVSAAGPGSVAATVNSVGGSSAASVNTATLLVNTSQSGNKLLASPANGSSGAPAFRAIVSADLPVGNLTDVGTDGIVITGGTGAVIGAGTSLAQHVSDATHNGYLSSSDWSSFNSKQPAGSYITALTGDVSATGPGSSASTVNSVGGSSAANVNSATIAANAATSANTPSTIVKRDGAGDFNASNIGVSTLFSAGNSSIDLTTGTLYDSAAAASIVWASGALMYPDGTTISVKYHLGYANSSDGNQSINWEDRKLIYSDGTTTSIDWNNGLINDSSELTSIDYGGRLLYFDDGGTVALDYSTASAGVKVSGTQTNDNAASGIVGEYVSSADASGQSFPASTNYGDATSLALTPGDWDVTSNVLIQLNGAVITGSIITGISTTSGNSGAGLLEGNNRSDAPAPTATNSTMAAVPVYRVSIASPTTVYLKVFASYTGGPPLYFYRLSARRAR